MSSLSVYAPQSIFPFVIAQIPEEIFKGSLKTEQMNIITDLGEAGYRLLKPILIEIQQSEECDSYIASFPSANIYGSGKSLKEAKDNLRSLILDFFDTLSNNETTLGKSPKDELRTLQQYIVHDL